MRATIGIVDVAALAASADDVLPSTTMTATSLRTRSAAKSPQQTVLAVRPAVFDPEVLPLDEAGFDEPLPERLETPGP